MPPPLKPCPFPDGQFTLLWREVITHLSRSPHLSKVKSFEAWLGGAASIEPFTLAELPALRVMPAAGAFKWADECRFDGPLILEVRFAVAGTRATDLFNFWSAIARALSPTNEWMRTLQPLGAYNVTMTAPALRPRLCCENQAIEAEGHITLLTNVSV